MHEPGATRIDARACGVIAICGLKREARIARRVGGVLPLAGGGSSEQLLRELGGVMHLLDFADGPVAGEPSIGGIASFGLCGALDPTLAVGDVVVGHGGDPRWAKAVHDALGSWSGNVSEGLIFSNGTLADSAAAKAELRVQTGTIAVDMETHIAARVAAEHALPFLAVRVVSDRADQTLPPAFAVAMRPGGGTDLPAMLGSLARHPGQLAQLITAAANGARALAALRRLALALGPGLGCPYAR